MNKPTSIFILAPHRSGSSTISGVLAHLGVYMGEGLKLKSHEYNPKGFFEDIELVDFNMELTESWADLKFNDLTEEDRLWYKDYVEERDKTYRYWGVKDPRLCVLSRYMIRYAQNPKLLLNKRDPEAIAQSLVNRDNFSFEYALEIAENYIQEQESVASDFDIPSLVVYYEDLVENTESIIRQQIIPFVFEGEIVTGDKIQEAVEFVDPELKHY